MAKTKADPKSHKDPSAIHRLMGQPVLAASQCFELQNLNPQEQATWRNLNQISQGILMSTSEKQLAQMWKGVDWTNAPNAHEIVANSANIAAIRTAPIDWVTLLSTPDPYNTDKAQLQGLFARTWNQETSWLAHFFWGNFHVYGQRSARNEIIQNIFLDELIQTKKLSANTLVPSTLAGGTHARLLDVALALSASEGVKALWDQAAWSKEQSPKTAFAFACMIWESDRIFPRDTRAFAQSMLTKMSAQLMTAPINWAQPYAMPSRNLINNGVDANPTNPTSKVSLGAMMLGALLSQHSFSPRPTWAVTLTQHIVEDLKKAPQDVFDQAVLSFVQYHLTETLNKPQHFIKIFKKLAPQMSKDGITRLADLVTNINQEGPAAEKRSLVFKNYEAQIEDLWADLAKIPQCQGMLNNTHASSVLLRTLCHLPFDQQANYQTTYGFQNNNESDDTDDDQEENFSQFKSNQNRMPSTWVGQAWETTLSASVLFDAKTSPHIRPSLESIKEAVNKFQKGPRKEANKDALMMELNVIAHTFGKTSKPALAPRKF